MAGLSSGRRRPVFGVAEASSAPTHSAKRSYGGRPHWGKRHFSDAASLRDVYPRWDDFQAARDRLDPGRAFTNEYAERVLGP